MALQKEITTPAGYSANYIRFRRIDEWDRETKVACFRFDLWKDQTAASTTPDPINPLRPAVEMAFRLRVTGDAFDTWFGNAALSEELIIAQAYEAAKAIPVSWWGQGMYSLADATDV